MSNLNTNVGMQPLDYNKTLQQLNSLKDNDVLCIKDGQLCAWSQVSGDEGPNTNDVLTAVRDMLVKKMGDGVIGTDNVQKGMSVINDMRKTMSAKNKDNHVYVKDVKAFLTGFKDITSKPVENKKVSPEIKTKEKTGPKVSAETKEKTETTEKTEAKGIGYVPKSGETLTMTRAELEKNLDKWIEAGYRVTIEVENKGSYQLQGRSESKKDAGAHVYDAIFTSDDGTVSNKNCQYELPDCGYAVAQKSTESQPTNTTLPKVNENKIDNKNKSQPLPQPEIKVKITKEEKPKENPVVQQEVKSEVKITTEKKSKEKLKDLPKDTIGQEPKLQSVVKQTVHKQTEMSNTCFLWSLYNSYGQNKKINAYAKNDKFFNQSTQDKISVVTVYGEENFDVNALKNEVKNLGNKGDAFLKKLENLQSGFEKNLVLYCYAKNVNSYRENFDAKNDFPVGESEMAAPLLGLDVLDQQQVKFEKGSNNDLKPVVMGENGVDHAGVLKAIKERLDNNALVTLNLDGAHFVSVKSIDVKNNTVTYLDSSFGEERTKTLEELGRAYSTHNTSRVLTFSVFGPNQGDKVAANMKAVLDFVEDLADGKTKQPKSMLMTALMQKCGGDLDKCKGYNYDKIKSFKQHIGEIRKNMNEIIITLKKDEVFRQSMSQPLINKDDSAAAFLSNIFTFLGYFANANNKYAQQ